ncbi:leucyl aminopeptidase [Aquincola sp. J276]|uniref:leucyl aminopeptidase n=1 Tax=Aquincola sp. J276 TaxID=2898432 RepID=UPI0021518F29|nr:leucyl aminopeptidase [Aquincola sp. J276]MCR5867514.1 leucyl aminopeptidase [Aquincola sp. J276]
MDFRSLSIGPSGLGSLAADALLVVVVGEAVPATLDTPVAALLNDAIAQGDFALKAGRSLYLHRPAGLKVPRLAFAAAPASTVKAFKAAVAAGVATLKALGAKHLAVACAGAPLTPAHADALVGAIGDAVYLYTQSKPSAPPASRLAKVTLLCTREEATGLQKGLLRAAAVHEGVTLARECANLPGNIATPTFLAEQAKSIGKQFGMKVQAFDRKAVEKIGMGSFLSVAQGSDEPLQFIVMQYQGAGKNDAPVVLVGKGITFDTGGISLKPGAEMDEMKFDMGGAASVLGTMRAIGQLKPKVNVVALIPSCENMPSGRAVKPGDVVTSLSGQTIEILNTDAEGRLILCDALTYAERFKPRAVVDIATLTGACVIALGHIHSGLFTADDQLAADLMAAADSALDSAWRMPLDEEYGEGLKSNFADMANIGGRPGGAITAAMFLKRFTAKYRWAHLDIAGTAWKGGAAKGSTGRPVPLLTHFVLQQAR